MSRETRTVPIDREATLRQAERLKGQGRLDLAIAEYVRLVEEQPRDWNTINALGDLYLRAGDVDRAVVQFVLIADHLFGEGFFPKAAAVYKKALKIKAGDDHALWQLADIAGRNGLSLDARSHYNRLIQDRRAAGNEQGAVDCVIRLGQLADATVEAKTVAAGALLDRGEKKPAARLILGVADLHTKEGRGPEALIALREAAQLDPDDGEIQEKLAAVAFIEEAEPIAEPEPPSEPVLVAAPEPVVAPEPTATSQPVAAQEPALQPAPEPVESLGDALPLESFFEELRSKVARDQEARVREQLDREKS